MFELSKVPSQMGRIAIVTGSNTGIGYHTALQLAIEECKVVMACRNKEKADLAKASILKQVPEADLVVMELDLSSLASVRMFAENFNNRFEKLDILINNAGIMVPPFSKTMDGFESQMGANYFGHFLLTGLLMPQLQKTPGSRIVSLSSIAHHSGKIDFENLNAEKSYSKSSQYGQSKLACLMFAYELQRKLENAGLRTISVAAHPGVSPTELFKNIPAWLLFLLKPLAALLTHRPEKASMPSLMAALDPTIHGGDYIGPTGFMNMSGAPGLVNSKPHARDIVVAKQLWKTAETLTNFEYNI